MKLAREKVLYKELLERIAGEFTTTSGQATADKYIQGLLSPIERKNGWQMAETVGESTPYAIQQFLYRGNRSTRNNKFSNQAGNGA